MITHSASALPRNPALSFGALLARSSCSGVASTSPLAAGRGQRRVSDHRADATEPLGEQLGERERGLGLGLRLVLAVALAVALAGCGLGLGGRGLVDFGLNVRLLGGRQRRRGRGLGRRLRVAVAVALRLAWLDRLGRGRVVDAAARGLRVVRLELFFLAAMVAASLCDCPAIAGRLMDSSVRHEPQTPGWKGRAFRP